MSTQSQRIAPPHDRAPINWRERFHAAGIHLGLSLAIAGLAALLVFGLWYPYPYREISGGRELFFLVVAVDVVLGPLITLAIFNRRKPWTELRRDLAIVVLIQLAALGYGLWTVFQARPVHMVFEIDRFRAVHAYEVVDELMARKPADIDARPLLGPTLLAVRAFKNSNESMEATMSALQGVHLGARPDFWKPYASAKAEVLAAAKPVSLLKTRFPARAAEIEALLSKSGRTSGTAVYLPMTGRDSFWTAFVDPITADVIGYLPLDSF